MYSSPMASGRTGVSARSSRWTWVLSMGRPIGGSPAGSSARGHAVDQTVVSVGP